MQKQTVHDDIILRQRKRIMQHIALMEADIGNAGLQGLLSGSGNSGTADVNPVDLMANALLLQSAGKPECLIAAAAGYIQNREFLLRSALSDQITDATPDRCPGAAPAIDATQAGQRRIVQRLFQIRTVHQFGLAMSLQQSVRKSTQQGQVLHLEDQQHQFELVSGANLRRFAELWQQLFKTQPDGIDSGK